MSGNASDSNGSSYGKSTSAGNSTSNSTPQLTPQQMLQLYNQYLPQSLSTTSNQAAPTANALANAAAGANPIYTQSGLDQLNGLAGGYQQAGANLSAQQAASQNDLLNGAGGAAARSANALSNELNPAQAASNRQATNLVNSINLNGLSPGEQAATERSLNQSNYATGNLGLNNATNAVSNAMNFGNALTDKRQQLGSALGAAGNVAANQNSFVNPVGTALNAGNTASNFGLGTFNPTQANSNLTTPYSYASSFGNQLTGIGSAAISKGSSSNNGTSTNVGQNSSSSVGGGINCYLTTACCGYKGLPDDCEELTILRKFRDEYVPAILVVEYYKTAPSIVPFLTDKALEYIYGVVTSCVKDIKDGNKKSALDRYTNMVKELKGA